MEKPGRFGRPTQFQGNPDGYRVGRPTDMADYDDVAEQQIRSETRGVYKEVKEFKYGRPEPPRPETPPRPSTPIVSPAKNTKLLPLPKTSCPQQRTPSPETRRRNVFSEYELSQSFLHPPPYLEAIWSLENGILVNLHNHKKKPESLHMMLYGDRGELAFVRSLNSKPLISVKMDEVKEICTDSRQRLNRTSEDAVSREFTDPLITILYGTSFVLNSVFFSLQKNASKDAGAFDTLCLGLEVAFGRFQNQNFHEQREKWFNCEYKKLLDIDTSSQSGKEKVTLKHVLVWFRRNSFEITKQYLTLTQKKLNLPDSLGFQDFNILVSQVLTTHLINQTDPIMNKYGKLVPDKSSSIVNQASFKYFLREAQKEMEGTDGDVVEKMMTCFPRNVVVKDPVFSHRQFDDYLFCCINSILNPSESKVNQSMDLPLSQYWIASSHNTYLTGNQWKSDSSVETYARSLRMGCRCLELDCYDGPDGKPIITHGKTFTSKIRVSDVLVTIKEHAWVVTDYPLILSIENHCSLAQQRVLATLFKDTFQDDLLTEQVDPNEKCLPSPNQLQRKIIIKNKKLPRDGKVIEPKGGIEGMDLVDLKKVGSLLLKYASEEVEEENPEEENIKDYFEGYESDDDLPEDEVALNSKLWYHGAFSRQKAEDIIDQNRNHGDGTFLLRVNKEGNYVISFLCRAAPDSAASAKNDIIHSIIKSRQTKDGRTEYLIGNEVWHKNIPELVEYYKRQKLSFRGKSLKLTFPIYKQFDFYKNEWFFKFMDRITAEDLLRKSPQIGTFLVRNCSMDNSFSISFRSNRTIYHFQIMYVNKKFVLSNFRFTSMETLISYYQKHPIHQAVKLTVPASYKSQDYDDEDMHLYEDDLYTDPQLVKTVKVQALYDFNSSTGEEMSFKRGAYITNVVVVDEPWWKGDHGEYRQKQFPANYVHVLEEPGQEGGEGKPNDGTLHLVHCDIENNIQEKDGVHYFCLNHSSLPFTLHIGSGSQMELTEWLGSILETANKVNSVTQELHKQEKSRNIAQELSDLIIYCQSVTYNLSKQGQFYEMSSFSEEKISKDDSWIIQYNQNQLSRVYPKMLRVSSTNYDPIPRWNLGCQLLAMNYQTPDRFMQINQARFLQNGGCGYVLKPDLIRSPAYNPADPKSLLGVTEPIVMTVTVHRGRNLSAGAAGVAVSKPFVVVEVLGLQLDNQRKRTRLNNCETSLSPIWKQDVFEFQISCPELAFIRFEVYSENDETKCLSQATFPLPCIRQGYRSVQLKNGFSENLFMSKLLVHIHIKNPKEEEEKSLFRIMEETRRLYNELSLSNDDKDEQKLEQLQQTEKKLLEYLDQTKMQGYCQLPTFNR